MRMVAAIATEVDGVRCGQCRASDRVSSLEEAQAWAVAHNAESGCTLVYPEPGLTLRVVESAGGR